MRKRLLSLLLALTLLFGILPTAGAVSLPPPSWARSSYQRLNQAGYYGFPTSGPITRAEFFNLVMVTLQLVISPDYMLSVQPVPDNYFADNPRNSSSSYYVDSIYKAAACGIAGGRIGQDGLRYLDARSTITRQECAKILCACLDFANTAGYGIPAAGASASYTDQRAIASWAAPYTSRISGYGLMVGDQRGNFAPSAQLDWPSAVVLAVRMLDILTQSTPGQVVQSKLDWELLHNFGGYTATGMPNYPAKPCTGYRYDLRVSVDSRGIVTSVVALSDSISVERFDSTGKLTFSKSVPMELPIFGGFLAGSDGCYYLAFGDTNKGEDDSKEVWRIVRYDSGWNRLGAASVTGGQSISIYPFQSTVSRMALSDSGELTLHSARGLYDLGDGLHHQASLSITVDTKDMSVIQLSSPLTMVSHSFGQFVQYDGSSLVTVDHGDANPRAFYLYKDGLGLMLLPLTGPIGQNVTHAIGSGFEVSGSGYLFLGCSAPQKDFAGEENAPWNLFLCYGDKDLSASKFTWLTHSKESIDTARLVKLGENRFAALWMQDGCLHYQMLDGTGAPVGQEQVHPEFTAFPPTQPAVKDGVIYWIAYSVGQPRLFTLNLGT